MKSFSKFLKEARIVAKNGIFYRAIPTSNSMKEIEEELGETNLDMQKDLHITVMFSKEPVDVEMPDIKPRTLYEATITHLEYWPGHDDSGFVVAIAQSEGLAKLHNKIRSFGIKPTYDKYKPHMTIITPAPEKIAYADYIELTNERLKKNPLTITLYDAGYVPNPESKGD